MERAGASSFLTRRGIGISFLGLPATGVLRAGKEHEWILLLSDPFIAYVGAGGSEGIRRREHCSGPGGRCWWP